MVLEQENTLLNSLEIQIRTNDINVVQSFLDTVMEKSLNESKDRQASDGKTTISLDVHGGLQRAQILTQALIEAIKHNRLDVITLLVERYKMNLNNKEGPHGRLYVTPRRFAEQLQKSGHNRATILEFLKKNGAE